MPSIKNMEEGSGKQMKFFRGLKFLYSRMFITFVLIAVQIVWLTLLMTRVVHYAGWITTAFQLLSILMALYIINNDDVPAYRMGWILVIMVVPLFGGLLYVLLGEKRPARKLRERLANGKCGHSEYISQAPQVMESFVEAAPRAAATAKYISTYAEFPVWQNTQVKYHSLGQEQFEDMLTELNKAQHFIFLEYFIIEEGYMWNTILDILKSKVQQGVDVRVIYDDMGCLPKIPASYHTKLEKYGIKCMVFNPFIPIFSMVMNNRDHRKMMIIDGNTVFTGGINLADEYINRVSRFGHWKDTGVMLKGDAVWNFTVMFLELWNSFHKEKLCADNYKPSADIAESDGFVQPFGDSPLDGETVSVNVYIDILAQAKNYVYIFTPYLAISDELQLALIAAAKRGVDVRMVLPGIPDKKIAYRLSRSYYNPLLKAGIQIYEYTPGFIHAKSYVCDDGVAVVGTINMDYRSLYLHFECGVYMYGCDAINRLKQDALDTFMVSHQVTLQERKRNLVQKLFGGLFDSILRVFAPLF